MSIKKRIDEIDLIKSLGIIFVVAHHANSPFYSFTVLFTMPIFFIASGFTYRDRNASDFKSFIEFVKKKIKTLIMPYFWYNFVFSILHNVLLNLNFYTDNHLINEYDKGLSLTHYWGVKETIISILNGLLFRGDNQLFQGIWFFKCLFIISIAYCFVDFVIKKFKFNNRIIIQTFISIISLYLGFFSERLSIPTGIGRVFTFYAIYHIGVLLDYKKETFLNIKKEYNKYIFLFSFIFIFAVDKLGLKMSAVRNRYPSPVMLILLSLAGWYFTWELSSYLKRNKTIKEVLLEIGKRTFDILMLHVSIFRIPNYLKVLIYDLPMYSMASIPTITEHDYGFWWFIYMSLALIIGTMFSKFKETVKNKIKNIIV